MPTDMQVVARRILAASGVQQELADSANMSSFSNGVLFFVHAAAGGSGRRRRFRTLHALIRQSSLLCMRNPAGEAITSMTDGPFLRSTSGYHPSVHRASRLLRDFSMHF